MEKVEILKRLNECKSDDELLDKLINDLTDDLRKENFITKPSDKKRLKAIEKLLKVNEKIRPVLSSFSVQDGLCCITDSYELYELNENYLPFKISKTSKQTDDEINKYASKYGLNIQEGIYPDFSNLLPKTEPVEIVTINLNDELLKIKTQKEKIGQINGKIITVGYDLKKMKNLIDILKIDNDFEIELYGDIKPLIVRKNGEIGLILPIKIY